MNRFGQRPSERLPEPMPDTELRTSYRPPSGIYDEMMTEGGALRPHWRRMVEGIDALGPGGMTRRWDMAQRLIHENGVTYNVYGDPRGMERPWALDPMPVLMDAAEWRGLESGLIQRARLLNALLADIYGEQRLLTENMLPPALVFANPRFLRPCHGVPVPRGTFLHFYAVDLARGPDGSWWVIGDRTQAPSGAGYALENRTVVSRSLPELFRDNRVHRLAGFFQAVRASLASLSPRPGEPMTVLLTPGPYNETYFEHAYLARHLGCTMAEGDDLTVRDDIVYLKTLGGLRRVDVILRRLDDDFADPLELRSDSALGVAGLLQAVRAGTVAVANALGSGVVECAALMGFLPALCRHVLGEDLALPSVATWWCGQQDPRSYVLDQLDRLVVRPTFDDGMLLAPSASPLATDRMRGVARDRLRQRIAARGHAFLAQQQIALSTVPTWLGGALLPRPMTLRVYLVATETGYAVMPGGLARVATSEDALAVSTQRGDGSKDVWVLGDGRLQSAALPRPPEPTAEPPAEPRTELPAPSRRIAEDLPSRAAESMFWLGRYAERAETEMRLVRALLRRLGDDPAFGGAAELSVVLEVLVGQNRLDTEIAEAAEREGADTDARHALEAEAARLVYEAGRPGGLRDTLSSLTRTAFRVRDRLSRDVWRTLNQVHRPHRGIEEAFDASETLGDVADMMQTMSAFAGLATEAMPRGEGWRFLDIGRRIERAVQVAHLSHGLLGEAGPNGDAKLGILLELAESAMIYRARYFSAPLLEPVLDLLLADESNPRSIGFQLAALEAHAALLPRQGERAPLAPEQRVILAHRTELRLAEIPALCIAEPSGARPGLTALLDRLTNMLPTLSDTLGQAYFAHAAGATERNRPLP